MSNTHPLHLHFNLKTKKSLIYFVLIQYAITPKNKMHDSRVERTYTEIRVKILKTKYLNIL